MSTQNKKTTLYGAPHSLYTGRARSYLIKAGIPYREEAPNSVHFHKVVKPAAGGRIGMPTVELADGTVIRDGAAIIDHFESQSGNRFSPRGAKQSIVSLLFDVIGAEGLLRPAMHYRWNFDRENLEFLIYHFEMVTEFGERGKERAQTLINAMRNGAGPSFGVLPNSLEVIEDLYADQLKALDTHFSEYGYLLGGHPCIGDFGLIAPMFGHLGRDPKPLSMMLKDGKSVYRWVERMNRATSDLCEFENQSENWLPNDDIPDTLINLMKVLAEDFVPETLAAADCINEWIEQQDCIDPGTAYARGVGTCSFMLRGCEIKALAQPYRFYLLQRVQDAFGDLTEDARKEVEALLSSCGMASLLDAKLSRKVGRSGNVDIWM